MSHQFCSKYFSNALSNECVATPPGVCILLSSFALSTILLTFSVNIFCALIMNLCCDHSIFQAVFVVFELNFLFYYTLFCPLINMTIIHDTLGLRAAELFVIFPHNLSFINPVNSLFFCMSSDLLIF